MLEVLHKTENADGTGDLTDVLYFDSLACVSAYLEEHGSEHVSDAEGSHGWPGGQELDYPSYCAQCGALVTDNALTEHGRSYVLENLESWSAEKVHELIEGFDMRSEAVREMTRRLRARHSGLSMASAYRWATSWVDSLEARAEIEWSETRNGNLIAKLERDGFTVTLKIETDEYAEPDGKFTNFPGPDAVRIPDTYRDRDSYKYYEPLVSYREHREGLAKIGFGKAQAHELATSYVREEMERNVSADRYVYCLDATAYREGVELGSASLCGYEIDSGAGWHKMQEEMTTAVVDNGLIEEAVSDARATLARLKAS